MNGWAKGMNNVAKSNELGADTLRNAVNVDISDGGKVSRRKGHALVTALTGAHSLWADSTGNAYFVHGNALKKLLSGGIAQNLGSVSANGNHMSYVEVNGEIFFSCATCNGKVSDGKIQPWGIETPSNPPAIGATTGILNAGTYHAAVTYLLADGRESGASALSKVTLNNVGGISVLGMPTPVSPLVTKKRLYLSTADGEELFLANEMGATGQFAVIGSPAIGHELRSQYITSPQFSKCLAEVNGRIFMVSASSPKTVSYTEALDFDHVDSRKNFYQFPSDVTLIAATKTGLYVCADKTYFIASAGMDDATQSEVFDYIGIANTAQLIPSTHEYIWMTGRGAVIGREGGQAELLSASSLATGSMTNAASMVREQDGIRQFVVVGNQTEGSSVQAGSYAEAEIIRRSN